MALARVERRRVGAAIGVRDDPAADLAGGEFHQLLRCRPPARRASARRRPPCETASPRSPQPSSSEMRHWTRFATSGGSEASASPPSQRHGSRVHFPEGRGRGDRFRGGHRVERSPDRPHHLGCEPVDLLLDRSLVFREDRLEAGPLGGGEVDLVVDSEHGGDATSGRAAVNRPKGWSCEPSFRLIGRSAARPRVLLPCDWKANDDRP